MNQRKLFSELSSVERQRAKNRFPHAAIGDGYRYVVGYDGHIRSRANAIKPRDQVVVLHPQAECKRIGLGLYRVIVDGKCLGHGGLPHVAWQNALKYCVAAAPTEKGDSIQIPLRREDAK